MKTMGEKANDVILKIARGESVAKEELSSVADLFANTTTNVVVFAIGSHWIKWKMIISKANIASYLLLPEDGWQQNIDRALDFGDIIIIDNDLYGEEIYNALIVREKASRKVIIRDYPIPETSEPKGITIYRNIKYFRPRALRYAVKVSVVLRHAVIPFDASKIPFLVVDNCVANILLTKALMTRRLGYNGDLFYRAIGNLEASFIMERFHPLIVMTDFNHVGPSGAELIKMVCAKPEYDDVVIGFRSVLNYDSDIESFYCAGADYYLYKVERVEYLIAMMRSLTQTSQYVKVYNEILP